MVRGRSPRISSTSNDGADLIRGSFTLPSSGSGYTPDIAKDTLLIRSPTQVTRVPRSLSKEVNHLRVPLAVSISCRRVVQEH